jgi:anthranilate synthase
MKITANSQSLKYKDENSSNKIDQIVTQLDEQIGVVLVSRFEYPGRYSRWDVGFVNPPIYIWSYENEVTIEALNKRGKILLPFFYDLFNEENDFVESITNLDSKILINLTKKPEGVSEENRSKTPSPFLVLKKILNSLSVEQTQKHEPSKSLNQTTQRMTLRADATNQNYDPQKTPYERLGIFGAFGYDLGLDFYDIERTSPRNESAPNPSIARDMAVFLPDELTIVDHRRETCETISYEFEYKNESTKGLERTGKKSPYVPDEKAKATQDPAPGEYAKLVEKSKEYFARGDLFEVNPTQLFIQPYLGKPSRLFEQIRDKNPSPYGAFLNIGHGEWLASGSPEMYVRVENHYDKHNELHQIVESAPIAGTIARGDNAIEDYKNILTLLNSTKEEAELTMCTDVDRNDKARICEGGSIEIVGRRLIEMYSKLIHTVDHVKGTLRKDYDAIDAILTHMWSVTMTGAPKLWAMKFIEKYERNPRDWYAGAIGWLGANGEVNTGMTIRTVRLNQGRAEVRAGATLLHLCDPDSEEKETELKASAFVEIIKEINASKTDSVDVIKPKDKPKVDSKVLFLDHEDSFVHMLASYFRNTGAEVVTYSSQYFQKHSDQILKDFRPDLIVLSPGPGNPSDFNMHRTLELALAQNVPIFGVCLGLQGLVEYFGGQLNKLDNPTHGIESEIKVMESTKVFSQLPRTITVGRYHSLYADSTSFPNEHFEITMRNIPVSNEQEVPMAIEHKSLPISAVQFHPESLMTLTNDIGQTLIDEVVNWASNYSNW